MGGGLAEFAASRHSVKVAVSNSAAEEAQKFYGARVDLVIENGVDCSMFMPRDRLEARERFGLKATGQPLALFAGRAEPRKGPNIALLAAQEAGFHLLVAGERPIGGALNLGSLSPLDLAWAFAAADCVVFPTSYEACSYVVLEALAVGVPLITTRVGWARDLDQRVPGYEQLLIQPEIKEVAAAMRFSIDNDLTEITGAARHLVRTRNSMEEFSKQWVELANSFLPNL
jgi:glycosyltransferase involved in cell wall biosynthesis